MNIFWKNSITSGSFTSAPNWVQGVVPGANDVAELTTSGALVIDKFGTTTTVLGLNVVSTAILAVQGSLTATDGTAAGANRGTIDITGLLSVGGPVDNIGAMNVLSTDSILNFQSFDATLKGSGTVNLDAALSFLLVQPSSKLTNVDNTIQGQGMIVDNTPLMNQKSGVIDANFTNGALVLDAPVTNSGFLKATGTNAALVINETVNNAGGFIAATGTSQVDLSSDILGGTLTTTAGGEIVANGATLDGTGGHVVTNSGTVTVKTGEQATLTGVINNLGSLTASSATLSIESATTIEGGGVIDLSNSGSLVGTPGAVLTNVNNTIFSNNGSGNIGGSGWELINESNGQIGTSLSGGSLTIDLNGSGGFISNAGRIEALGGSLTIGGNIRNASAGVVEAFGDNVTLEGSGSIVGGKLRVGGLGPLFDVPNGAVFTLDGGSAVVPTNKMITIDTAVTVDGTLNLQGTINNSGGSIAIDSAAITSGGVLVAQAVGKQTTVTLEGHGTVGLSDVPAGDVPNAIAGGGAPVTLANVNNTIDGGGTIGGGGLTLNNEAGGIIDATSATPLVIDTGSNTVMNAGSMAAASSSTLVIGSKLSNTGKLNANGGTIVVEGGETGGSAVISGTGTVEFDAAATAGVTFASSSTGELILDDPAQYSGTIAGFVAGTQIDLPNFDFTGAHPTSYAGGVLTLTNTAGQTVKIKISGSHTLGSFNVSDDGNFNGTDDGTLITDPPVGKGTQALAGLFGQYIAANFPTTVAGAHTPLLAPGQEAALLLSVSPPHA